MSNKRSLLVAIGLIFLTTMAFGNTDFWRTDTWPNGAENDREQLLLHLANPYVAVSPAASCRTDLLADPGVNKVRLLDLRGLECYPQPDRLTACGFGDTLSLLFYTKSEAPIFDVFVEMNFGEGIVFDGYAALGSPDGMMMTLLDTVNTQNPESPVFRFNQLSRSGGAVVLQVGIRALCGVDFVANPPGISVNLSYPGCEEEFELDPITSEPIIPEVVFTNTPNQIIISDFGVDVCLQQDITQITSNAGAGEATLTITEYGFPAVSLNDLLVDGTPVPAADISINPANGTATVRLDGNANSGYFNGDGNLSTNEVSTLDLCFGITACPPDDTPDPITPTLAINSTCIGLSCGGNQDFETGNTIRVIANFGNAPLTEFELIQQPSACAGPDGNSEQYIFDVSIRASRTEPVQGQFDNLLFFLDDCDGGAFVIDSVGFFEGGIPTGALNTIPNVSSVVSLGSSGRLVVRMSNLIDDFDGPGGLADLDGDGFTDDLPGGETFRARLFFSPTSCAPPGACGAPPATQSNVCQFRRLSFQGLRNCGRNGFTTNINPGGTAFQNNTTGGFADVDTTRIYTGFNFGTFGKTGSGTPVSSTRTINFDFTLEEGDFNACPAPGGDLQFQLTYIGDKFTVDNLSLDNLLYDNDTSDTIPGVPVPAAQLTRQQVDSSIVIFTLDAGSGTTGMPMRYSVDMTFDTAVCLPAANNPLIASVVESCDDCECSPFIRACGSVVARVDPNDSPNCSCDYVSTVTSNRTNYGFTDRSRTVPLTAADFPGPDNQQLDYLLPGDTIEVTSEMLITNSEGFNNNTERLNFVLFGLQDNSSLTPNLTARMDINAVRIQEFVVDRGGTIFDLADIPVNGSTAGRFAGILINGSAEDERYPNAVHPGLPVGGYDQVHQNSTNDYQDNNRIQILFFGEDRVLPGQFNSLKGLYDLIGGSFQDGDIIRYRFRVPVTLTPDELRDGSATRGPLNRNNIVLRSAIDGRSLNSSGGITPNQIAGGGTFNGTNGTTACLFQDTVFFYNPGIELASQVTYSPNGCGAEIEHTFSTVNPIPAGWYPNEYRPIIGLDSLRSEFPDPYIYAGGAYFELSAADGSESLGRVLYEPDSLAQVIGDEIAYCVDEEQGVGELYFFDEAYKNGVRAPNYFDFDTDTDVSLSGGTFPLLGVGGPAIGNPDELTIGYPLQRICTDRQPSTPLISGFSASYPYLADYFVRGYICNQGEWYPNGPLDVVGSRSCNGVAFDQRFYWPWLRNSLENPSRFFGDITYLEINTPVPENAVAATVSDPLLQDLGGGEMNTLTVCPDPTTGTIPGGTIVLQVPINVTLDGVTETGGGAADFVLVETNDTSAVYTVIIPMTLAAGECYNIDLETTLLFCGPDPICARIVPCPVDVSVVLAKDLDCVETICYAYRSGIPEVSIGFTFPTPTLCATETYQINFNNTGTSLLTDLDPLIFIPEGLTPTDFTVEISAAGVVTSTNPITATEDPDSTGVFGIAYVFDDAVLNALLGPDGLEPLGALTISFDLTSDCESFSGGRASAQLGAMADCDPYSLFERGPQIFLTDPDGDADFSIEPSRTEINCTDGGARLLLTSVNVGKAGATETNICFTLPPGITISPDSIQAIAPVDYTPVNFVAMPVGTGGATQLCFDGPEDLPIGAFFCLDVGFVLGNDVPCGPFPIGYTVSSTMSIACTDGTICELDVLNSDQFLDLEVVPATSVGTATVLAECNNDPSMIDLDFTIELESVGEAFSGDIDVELFFDLDANGQVDDFDSLLGTVTSSATIPADGTGFIEGSVTASTDEACGIVARLTIPGCACSVLELPFPVIEPGFVDRLDENITICPGEDFTIEGLCGTYELEFLPPAAGNVVIDNATGSATVNLNPGFGVEVPIDLLLNYSIGNCSNQEFVIKVTQLEEFEFGPYAIDACSVGSQRIDLNIPAGIQEDIVVNITPDTYLDDPNSLEPVITDPLGDISYTVEFSLNGECMSQTTIDVNVVPAPEISFAVGATGCSTGIRLDEYISITPSGTEVFFLSLGDGTFTPSNRLSDAPTYVPGPQDLAAGSVMIRGRSENPEGPCGLVIARGTVEILLVDCGSFFWDGDRD